MPAETPADLAETFAEMARTLAAQPDVQQTLQRIVDLAVDTIDGCDHAGVSLVQKQAISTPAASDEVPERVDAIQYEVDDGPCLSAIRDHEVLQADDLTQEDRWTEFSHRATDETGVRSMLCFRLFAEADTLGALNLYSKRQAAFHGDHEARAVGMVFAAHAAVALAAAQRDENLVKAIESRDIIGQAKGILMARHGVTADEAFDILRRASQRLNIKLRDVAEDVTQRAAPPEKP